MQKQKSLTSQNLNSNEVPEERRLLLSTGDVGKGDDHLRCDGEVVRAPSYRPL